MLRVLVFHLIIIIISCSFYVYLCFIIVVFVMSAAFTRPLPRTKAARFFRRSRCVRKEIRAVQRCCCCRCCSCCSCSCSSSSCSCCLWLLLVVGFWLLVVCCSWWWWCFHGCCWLFVVVVIIFIVLVVVGVL